MYPICLLSLEFNGIQWISMDFNGIQLISVDFNGIQRNSMDFNGFQWNSMDFHRFQWNIFCVQDLQDLQKEALKAYILCAGPTRPTKIDLQSLSSVCRTYKTYENRPRKLIFCVQDQWNSMDANEFRWNSMEFNGFQWISMEFNGMEFNGIQWNSMDFNGLQWNSIIFCVQDLRDLRK